MFFFLYGLVLCAGTFETSDKETYGMVYLVAKVYFNDVRTKEVPYQNNEKMESITL